MCDAIQQGGNSSVFDLFICFFFNFLSFIELSPVLGRYVDIKLQSLQIFSSLSLFRLSIVLFLSIPFLLTPFMSSPNIPATNLLDHFIYFL